MKIIKPLVLVLLFLNLTPAPQAEAVCNNVVPEWNNTWCSVPLGYWGSYFDKGMKYTPAPEYVTATCPHVQAGYTCTKFTAQTWAGHCGTGYSPLNGYTCTKNNFSALQSGEFTLIGKNFPHTLTSYSIHVYWEKPSPFIYLYNAPEGEIDVTLDSQLDSYLPLPAFNQENGWDVTVKDSEISLDGTAVDHLFYELALNQIELTRTGRNFESKADVIAYLQDSDFLSLLGFSPTEKANSLGYLIPKIEETDSEYYYLNVLEEESIEESGTLNVTPTPDTIIRQYFAVYPTAAPVATIGDFVFPAVEEVEGFTVKETGEFLINSSMFVFFK